MEYFRNGFPFRAPKCSINFISRPWVGNFDGIVSPLLYLYDFAPILNTLLLFASSNLLFMCLLHLKYGGLSTLNWNYSIQTLSCLIQTFLIFYHIAILSNNLHMPEFWWAIVNIFLVGCLELKGKLLFIV